MTGTRQPASSGPVIGSVCTGYGGLDLGVLAALGGGRLAWCADPDPHIAQILAARLPGVPNLGDIRAVDWTAVEPVEVLTAGFPCQDISGAGKRLGIENGARSGLWTDIVAAVRVLRPALLVVENVAALRWKGGGLHRVLGDLAATGYDALWRSVRAADVGAAHRRERVFLLAWRRTLLHDPAPADADRARRNLQRIRRRTTAGRPFVAGPAATVADTSGHGAERLRGPRALADPAGTATRPQDQRQRDGHAPLDRGATSPDPDRVGREELHPRRPRGRAVASSPSPATADAEGVGHGNIRETSRRRLPTPAVPTGPADGDCDSASPYATSHRRHQGFAGTAGIDRRPDAAVRGDDRADQRACPNEVASTVDWGSYAPALQRWEQVLGRHTPHPTELGRHGRPVLAPAFVEHLMGLPPGWVTDLPLPRTAQLRALGNGVVPQQAAHAISLLLADLAALLDHDETEEDAA